MKNDENFLMVADNFIDSPQIIDTLLAIKNSPNYVTNLTRPWGEDLIPRGVGEVKTWVIENFSLISYLNARLVLVFENLRLSEYSFTFQLYEWQPGSFIPWHDDHGYSCAVTCYLDNNVSHGGEFLCKRYQDTPHGIFFEPVKNRALCIRNLPHCVSKIHTGTRTTLQLFGRKHENV